MDLHAKFLCGNKKRSKSVVFNIDQKMALRAFLFTNVFRICKHITAKSALSAIFWPLLKKFIQARFS